MSHVDSLAQTEMLAFWASQLSSIHLYLSMYTEPEEIEIAVGVRENIEYMQRIVETGELDRLVTLPRWIAFTLHIQIVTLQTIDLVVSIPLISNEQEQTTADPVLSLRRPVWLDRKGYSLLAQGLPRGPDSVFAGIEYLREAAPNLVYSKQNPPTAGAEESKEIVRVWFYFPSLSTREKRRDIVNWAPEYHLTGCVMAGKPGILCVEGSECPLCTQNLLSEQQVLLMTLTCICLISKSNRGVIFLRSKRRLQSGGEKREKISREPFKTCLRSPDL